MARVGLVERIGWYTTPVRPQSRAATLALSYTMEGARHDRDSRVGLEPVRELPRPLRLWLRGLERVRDSAGEPVPYCMARSIGHDVESAGSVAHRVRVTEIR